MKGKLNYFEIKTASSDEPAKSLMSHVMPTENTNERIRSSSRMVLLAMHQVESTRLRMPVLCEIRATL